MSDMFQELEEFKNYIINEVNPARIKNELERICESEIKPLFRTIEDFRKRWENPQMEVEV